MWWLLACGPPATETALAPAVCDDPVQRTELATDIARIDVPVCIHAVWPTQEIADRRWTDDLERQTLHNQIDLTNRLLRGAPEAEYMATQLDTGIRLEASRVLVHADAERVVLGELDATGRAQGLEEMAADWNVDGCANVYLLFDDDASWEGAWAGYPGELSHNAIAGVRKPSPRMMAHEWGHVFGLRHTHEDTFGPEWDGDCDVTGDLVCDTAPDPGTDHCTQFDKRGATNAESRSYVECEGDLAALDPTIPINNLMSYWNPPWASQGFSEGQIERMRCGYGNGDFDVLD
ncbi:MAG: hypothetical protein GY913_07435 [Proteobacteria bacterium]|nr:hypothetical protein [Pseudomonadota bacterium]